jgi:hypothetical protein
MWIRTIGSRHRYHDVGWFKERFLEIGLPYPSVFFISFLYAICFRCPPTTPPYFFIQARKTTLELVIRRLAD